MPLNENPFFGPVMQSIDMIAQENMYRQRMAEQEERQVAAEDRQYNRQVQLQDRALDIQQQQAEQKGNQQEYRNLTQYIQDYAKYVEGGGEPDPERLKASVDRRNDLIKMGVQPRMMQPGFETPEKGDNLVELPETVTNYFGLPAGTKVTEDQRYKYTTAYHDDIRQGKTRPTTPSTTGKSNFSTTFNKYVQNGNSIYKEGLKLTDDTEKLGIDYDLWTEWADKMKDIQDRVTRGEITEQEGMLELIDLGEFALYRQKNAGKGEKFDQAIDEVLNKLNKIE